MFDGEFHFLPSFMIRAFSILVAELSQQILPQFRLSRGCEWLMTFNEACTRETKMIETSNATWWYKGAYIPERKTHGSKRERFRGQTTSNYITILNVLNEFVSTSW